SISSIYKSSPEIISISKLSHLEHLKLSFLILKTSLHFRHFPNKGDDVIFKDAFSAMVPWLKLSKANSKADWFTPANSPTFIRIRVIVFALYSLAFSMANGEY
ncbi:unnamed protein product, partial [marine sediment metagenome]